MSIDLSVFMSKQLTSSSSSSSVSGAGLLSTSGSGSASSSDFSGETIFGFETFFGTETFFSGTGSGRAFSFGITSETGVSSRDSGVGVGLLAGFVGECVKKEIFKVVLCLWIAALSKTQKTADYHKKEKEEEKVVEIGKDCGR